MHIAHPTLAMWGRGLSVVVSMLRRRKPWRLGLTGRRDTKLDCLVGTDQATMRGSQAAVSFKGKLGSPRVVLWLWPDSGCLDGYGPGDAVVSVALSSRGVSEPVGRW